MALITPQGHVADFIAHTQNFVATDGGAAWQVATAVARFEGMGGAAGGSNGSLQLLGGPRRFTWMPQAQTSFGTVNVGQMIAPFDGRTRVRVTLAPTLCLDSFALKCTCCAVLSPSQADFLFIFSPGPASNCIPCGNLIGARPACCLVPPRWCTWSDRFAWRRWSRRAGRGSCNT